MLRLTLCCAPLNVLRGRSTAEDLTDEHLDTVLRICREAFMAPNGDGKRPYGQIASMIRRNLDKELNKGWCVVVGRRFGAFVTQRLKAYGYVSVVPGIDIVMWKA